MTSSTNEPAESTPGNSHKKHGCVGKRANWSGSNIAVMVVAFVLFWPIGLFVLYWILTGRDAVDLPGRISAKWNQFKGNSFSERPVSDNQVFNDYQQTQYDRIREIKDEIKERAKRFSDFRADAKRKADEEEFRKFMDDSPA